MRQICLVCVAIFLLGAKPVYAGNVRQTVDSLIQVIPSIKSDTGKVLAMCALSYNYFQIEPDSGIYIGKEALKLSKKIGYDRGIMNANYVTARCYAIQEKFNDALHYFQTALTYAEKLQDQRFIANSLTSLGALNTSRGQYDVALEYLLRAKKQHEKTGEGDIISIIINIAELYHQLNEIDTAIRYNKEGIAIAEEKGNSPQKLANLYSNIGGMYVLKEQPHIGLGYLHKALNIHKQMGNEKSTAFTYNNLGQAYDKALNIPKTKLPDSLSDNSYLIKKAFESYNNAISVSKKLNVQYVLSAAYHNMVLLYDYQHNYQKAFEYLLMEKELEDSLRNLDKAMEFARIEAEYANQKKNDSLTYANALKDEEIGMQRLQRNGIILFVCLIGAGGVLSFRNLQHKRKKLVAEKLLADDKLINAQHRLQLYTENLREKNLMIERIQEQISNGASIQNGENENGDILEKLYGSVILTDEHWQNFKELFDQVHPNFINSLKEKYPELSEAEQRFMTLSKLGLNNKEKAAMLGIGLSGMRNYKYRIIKKLNLSSDTSITEIANSI